MKRIILGIVALVAVAGWSPTASAFTMAPGTYTIAGRMLFDYNTGVKSGNQWIWVNDIDVVNVWQLDVTSTQQGSQVKFTTLFTSINSVPMVDGPFQGFRAAFDFQMTGDAIKGYTGTAANSNLTFYQPGGGVFDPDGKLTTANYEKFNTTWNGQFGAAGAYTMTPTSKNNFKDWTVHDIVTFVNETPSSVVYDLETANTLFWNSYASMTHDTNEANDLVYTLPPVMPMSAVPEPASLLLIGAGLAGLVGLRRKQ